VDREIHGQDVAQIAPLQDQQAADVLVAFQARVEGCGVTGVHGHVIEDGTGV